MDKFLLFFNAIIFVLYSMIPDFAYANKTSSKSEKISQADTRQQWKGAEVYIQIVKEEGLLELYVKQKDQFRLLNQYRICKFSGGLGPKHREGDLKSPEGFYQVGLRDLKPDSQFHKAINLGYPNVYDRSHGYTGSYLMIHGACNSSGCYAMTNGYIDEIYAFVEAALLNGQIVVPVHIYPFRMTEENMRRHRNSRFKAFWQELKPGYTYFTKNGLPPEVEVIDGRYQIRELKSARLVAVKP